MSGWFQEKSGEVVDVTQVKAGEAKKMASETGQSIQDRAVEAKDQTGSFLGEKSAAVTKAASETTEAAKKMGGEAMGKVSETVEAGKDRAVEGKDQTGGFLSEKTEAVKKTATETTDAAKEKSTEAAQYVQDTAAQYTKDPPVAPKENVFQQAGGNMMGAATGAKDAVMNTLGMGGDK
ncbi:ABA-inducible protein PHV A1-like [Triticum dicoccoides]|uniref:ABA-inducible protein PHV A1-like n=1 Tax=Triticum dicoccoides TaxID=85692 RepID=UPI0018906D67|nr:ABA-inducible protein PHV A1-like [Triticum dicoccoides]